VKTTETQKARHRIKPCKIRLIFANFISVAPQNASYGGEKIK
jgi:hypothetical protein